MSENFDFSTYAKNMRQTFSNKDMITDDGAINHKYFLVKKGAYWSRKEDEALIRGLELFGLGNWKDIKFYELDNYTEIEIELRASILLGTKNLKHLKGKNLKKEDINAERKKNGLKNF